MALDPARLTKAYAVARQALLAQRNADGFWLGELSSSALSTAVAVSALACVSAASADHAPAGVGARHASPSVLSPQSSALRPLISRGLAWIAANQNPDGGWGDTIKSFSNVSTTMLVRAAFHLAGAADAHADLLERANAFIDKAGGVEAVKRRYGNDKTFSVPILMNCALAGQVDWSQVGQLPFELACLPHSWYAAVNLPVVSYALPALIAIGQVRHHKKPMWNPITRIIRALAIKPSLRKLTAIQPASGGFLEAAPLTGFVAMSLAACGRAEHAVTRKCVEFLVSSVRADGSWPIDSNLSVWLTTLSVNALAGGPGDEPEFSERFQGPEWEKTRDWLLARQYREVHPYTNAAPGAWAWTHLSGGVPDVDDTAGALPALRNLVLTGDTVREAAARGSQWLLNLQNSDGGWPTFCRGWMNLPFDRSGPDLTAHALRAIHAFGPLPLGERVDDVGSQSRRRPGERCPRPVSRGLAYLASTQRPDGSWLPLWFGHQHAPDDENPVYGTAKVLAAYSALNLCESEPARRGRAFLLSVQNADGGWGGAANCPSSVEESALAVEAILGFQARGPWTAGSAPQLERGLEYLIARVENGTFTEPTPIGFYFAKLWYFEKLYPIIFTVAALARAAAALAAK